jgi:hypothetical protein
LSPEKLAEIACSTFAAAWPLALPLQRLQVLDEILLLLLIELETEQAVVVIDDVEESGEAPVVEEAPLTCVNRPLSGGVR